MFDSHVATLLDTAVSLVNALTGGERHGRPCAAPRDADLPGAVAAVLPVTSAGPAEIEPEQAVYLARAANHMRGVFEAVDEGRIDDAASILNTLLRSTGARPQLDQAGGEPWQVHFHGTDDTIAVGWSAGCATALTLAVGSDLAGRLGVCRAPQCDRVYVDNSRNAVRQFCSTACQSRVKAAAFRARKAARR
ncbi:CGNR zinc finger domain-containing protein [Streptomyces sp. MK37H]|uniref:CGNR zinc finger domain-containing protein n=1 Tax=Streptomyces sp. MK37H TaxID=2699117 RepID=UPI001B38318F|nr:CGNR zinc finger domain-containing protein [Streptomyces sp. MK37H]MBP8535531.1 CGNR zinc finger domain-containing protein [Streptomyces sp. MK37H]